MTQNNALPHNQMSSLPRPPGTQMLDYKRGGEADNKTNNKQMEKTIKEEIIEILDWWAKLKFGDNPTSSDELADQILSLISSRLPKEKKQGGYTPIDFSDSGENVSQGDVLANENEALAEGYNLALKEIKNLIK